MKKCAFSVWLLGVALALGLGRDMAAVACAIVAAAILHVPEWGTSITCLGSCLPHGAERPETD
ncbi:MAG TPA: hypothetical protein VG433_12920 [Pirellulales bacterium]|jgi:hypothetical protein|nr:hypothetical protein [Pirellulales bacterium]